MPIQIRGFNGGLLMHALASGILGRAGLPSQTLPPDAAVTLIAAKYLASEHLAAGSLPAVDGRINGPSFSKRATT